MLSPCYILCVFVCICQLTFYWFCVVVLGFCFYTCMNKGFKCPKCRAMPPFSDFTNVRMLAAVFQPASLSAQGPCMGGCVLSLMERARYGPTLTSGPHGLAVRARNNLGLMFIYKHTPRHTRLRRFFSYHYCFCFLSISLSSFHSFRTSLCRHISIF